MATNCGYTLHTFLAVNLFDVHGEITERTFRVCPVDRSGALVHSLIYTSFTDTGIIISYWLTREDTFPRPPL